MRTGQSWYSGTADAIFQNLYLLERSGAENVLILSGDHIYRMDYLAMLEFHREQQADCTVACMEVPLADPHLRAASATRTHGPRPHRPAR